MSKKKTNSIWFVRIRGSYLPNSKMGWLTYIPFIGYCISVTILAFSQSNTLWYQIFTTTSQWILATLLLTLAARQHSK